MPSQDTAAGLVVAPENPNESKGAFVSDIPRYDSGDDRSSDRPKSAVLVIVIARYSGKVNHGLIDCAIVQKNGEVVCCSQNIVHYNIDGPKIKWNPTLARTNCAAPHNSGEVTRQGGRDRQINGPSSAWNPSIARLSGSTKVHPGNSSKLVKKPSMCQQTSPCRYAFPHANGGHRCGQ